jgi:endonuclease YncB( thermonuclease family)
MRRILPLLLVLLAASPAWGADYSARVVGISDGDTITVLTADKVQHRIRLHGIDAPETGQDFGTRAKQFASELAFGRTVTVRVHSTDRYGRTVADVILPDGRLLNHEMVREGLAWWYRRYAPADRELERLESKARASRRGLWSHPNPVPPWEWRKGEGVPRTEAVIGNRRSRVYHKPTCRGATSMSEKNRVRFDTAVQAEAAGYRQAKDCQ